MCVCVCVCVINLHVDRIKNSLFSCLDMYSISDLFFKRFSCFGNMTIEIFSPNQRRHRFEVFTCWGYF